MTWIVGSWLVCVVNASTTAPHTARMHNFLTFFACRFRTAVAATLLAACPGLPVLADNLMAFNPGTYMIDGRMVFTPTPDMIVWDGGIASRVGSTWVGDGWSRYPGGRGALTTRMLRAMEEPEAEPVIRPRGRIRGSCCHDCEYQLLMWRSWP